MEGKANITIGQVNNIDKQKVSLSYFIGSFDNVQEAQIAKFAFDKVAEELGASIVDEACILGEIEDTKAKEEAGKIVLRVDDKEIPENTTPGPLQDIQTPPAETPGALPAE